MGFEENIFKKVSEYDFESTYDYSVFSVNDFKKFDSSISYYTQKKESDKLVPIKDYYTFKEKYYGTECIVYRIVRPTYRYVTKGFIFDKVVKVVDGYIVERLK